MLAAGFYVVLSYSTNMTLSTGRPSLLKTPKSARHRPTGEGNSWCMASATITPFDFIQKELGKKTASLRDRSPLS